MHHGDAICVFVYFEGLDACLRKFRVKKTGYRFGKKKSKKESDDSYLVMIII